MAARRRPSPPVRDESGCQSHPSGKRGDGKPSSRMAMRGHGGQEAAERDTRARDGASSDRRTTPRARRPTARVDYQGERTARLRVVATPTRRTVTTRARGTDRSLAEENAKAVSVSGTSTPANAFA